ncbi:MAG: hypothetical protein JEZ09_09850 [Salinivirgaceae bacterium]|nr:hypothetical protein [Salinivirgaceae bacterium]
MSLIKTLKSTFEFNNINNINKKLLSKKAFAITLLLIIIINIFFFQLEKKITFSSIQKRSDASGFAHNIGKHFFYFQYYKNLFPIFIKKPQEYSKKGAENLLKTRGNEAVMEYKHWTRLGENSRIFAYYPSAFLNGSAKNPSLKGFNTIVFILALITLFSGFYFIKKPLHGLILTLLINATPFFHYEVFARENIFALLACTYFLVLGLNINVIYKKHAVYKIVIIAVLSGIIIGFFSEMRAEIKIVTGSLLIIYLFSSTLKFRTKIIISSLLIVSLLGTKKILQNHFNNKFNEAKTIVENHDGHVYNGLRISGHRLWHPIFCGLGDFGSDKGYEWNDMIAYKYATPILKEKYGLSFDYTGGYHINEYYDSAKLYYKKFDDFDEYEEVVKNKVITDIKENPLWYAKILIRRINEILSVNIPFNNVGYFIIPLLLILILLKKNDLFLILFSSLPLSATSLLIYSGRGNTYNSIYTYIVLLIIILLLIEAVYLSIKKQKT